MGDLFLKWDHPHDDKWKHTKFQQLWVGPFQIAAKLGSSTYKLQDLQGWEENLPVNGLVLKLYFSSIKLTAFAHEKGIKLHYSANYYPQGNGLAESTNKNLIRILKKTMIENQRSWHLALPNALWADRVTPKNCLCTQGTPKRLNTWSNRFTQIDHKSTHRCLSHC